MKKMLPPFIFFLTFFSLMSSAQEAVTLSEKESRVSFHPRGPLGLFRLYSAERPESGPMSIGLGIYADYFYLKDFPTDGTTSQRLRGSAGFSWTPVDNVEMFFGGSALSSNNQDPGNLLQQVGNVGFGFKWAEDFNDSASLGIMYDGDLRRPLFDKNKGSHAFSHTGSAVGTFRFASPVKLHTNIGFRLDDTEDLFFTGMTEQDAVVLEATGKNALVGGVGVEFPLSRVNLSLEYSTEQTFKTSGIGYLDNPQRLTAGIRYFPEQNPNLSFGLAGNIGLFATRDTPRVYKEPDYSFILGMTYFLGEHVQVVAKPVEKTPAQTTTVVMGKVSDDAGRPIGGAQVQICDASISPLLTDETGAFKSFPVTGGTCEFKVMHPDYEAYSTMLTLSGVEMVQDAQLKRVTAPQGFLAITVKDTEGKALQANIVFPEIPAAQVVNTNEQGKIRMKLPEGKYLVEVRSAGKKSEQKIFEIIPGSEATGEYILVPGTARLENQRIVITRQVQFAAGKAEIREESKLILEEVASILKEHSEIKKLEVGGHTDATGSAIVNKRLSQRRAQAVVNQLVALGVPRSRLVAVGYGQDNPVASNATPEGRFANRRVEFRVIGR